MFSATTPICVLDVRNRGRFSLYRLAVTAFLLANACSDQTEPRAPGADPSSPPVDLNAQVAAADDPISLAKVVPGFGGFYLDEGTPVVYLKNPAERGNVERALAPFFRAAGLAASQLRVLPAKHDWAELERWFSEASAAVLASSGGIFVDADEASNRVLIAVKPGAAGRIRALVARLGIPEDAVAIQETEPINSARPGIDLEATLSSKVRPVVGGVQITSFYRGTGAVCTLGFNTISNGLSSFITISTCTGISGTTEGTWFYQPGRTLAPRPIGTEVSDPAYFAFTNGCPIDFWCRYSNASRAQYAPDASFSLGRIARTAGPNLSSDPTNNPKTITGSFSVTAEGNASAGMTVNKVGRTTGWTRGEVTNTCVNALASGSRFVFLCQNVVAAGATNGDGGSPVFRGSTHATLAGILWGFNTSRTVYVYSPISNIEQELGPLTTF